MFAIEVGTFHMYELTKQQRDKICQLIMNGIVAKRRRSSRFHLTKLKFITALRRMDIDIEQFRRLIIYPRKIHNLDVNEVYHACLNVKKWIKEEKHMLRKLRANQHLVEEVMRLKRIDPNDVDAVAAANASVTAAEIAAQAALVPIVENDEVVVIY